MFADAFRRFEYVRLLELVLTNDVEILNNQSLTGVTSFGHLQNLEHLDISNNDIDSLTRKWLRRQTSASDIDRRRCRVALSPTLEGTQGRRESDHELGRLAKARSAHETKRAG